ncbi:MAG: hypothetical protein WAW10_03910 [Gallionella sp.]
MLSLSKHEQVCLPSAACSLAKSTRPSLKICGAASRSWLISASVMSAEVSGRRSGEFAA